MKEEENFPSINEQGKNLAKFTFEVVKNVIDITNDSDGTKLIVSEEKQQERLSICKKCEYYSIRKNRCKKCGCYLGTKVKFGVSRCPINKW